MVNESNCSIQTSGQETRILQDATGSTEDVNQDENISGIATIDKHQDVKNKSDICLNRNAIQI